MADSRTNDWFLISSIYEVLLIVIIYLLIVLYWGPRFMKDRQPYSLKTFIKIYNFCQIIANAWLVQGHLAIGWMKDISLICVPDTYSYGSHYYKHSQILWWVLLLKIADCIETVVFVLRKKDKQISFLHVYHHVSSMLFTWSGVKFQIGDIGTFITIINCSVHVLMYIYYLLASFGPRVQTIIKPIKPYITILQMVQFLVFVFYMLRAFVSNCYVPRGYSFSFLLNVLINWFMFYKFYQKSYVLPTMKR